MGYILDNLTPILAATLTGLVIGFAYGTATDWHGREPGARPGLLLAILAALAEFWLASILAGALILAPSQAGPWTMALGSAVVIWIGFVAPALLVTLRYRDMPMGSLILDIGHWLLVMVAQAAVLYAVGLKHPA